MTLHVGAAGIVALLGATLLVIAVLGIHAGVLSPYSGFRLAAPAWLGGAAVALILALLSLRGERPSWLGLALALAMLLPVALQAPKILRLPVIHDISTDLHDPPAFVAAAASDPGRDLAYPDGDPRSAELQRRAYPDLGALDLAVSPEQALDLAERTALQLGWRLTRRDVSSGLLEATATSTMFRFVDDVVVRARPGADGTRIDVRSTSRVGRSDLGANAARIRAFQAALRALAGGDAR